MSVKFAVRKIVKKSHQRDVNSILVGSLGLQKEEQKVGEDINYTKGTLGS